MHIDAKTIRDAHIVSFIATLLTKIRNIWNVPNQKDYAEHQQLLGDSRGESD